MPYYSLMSEASSEQRGAPSKPSRGERIDSLVEALASILDHGSTDVPDWVAQELTFGQMRVLFLVAKHGPSPVSRVAEWLGVGLPATSGIVDRVERHGLLMRRRRDDDRRVVECVLTDRGRRLLEEIAGLRREIVVQTLEILSDDELADMARLAGKLSARLASPSLIPDRSSADLAQSSSQTPPSPGSSGQRTGNEGVAR
jgi:DNA-binding MarR family transcriptional regulator